MAIDNSNTPNMQPQKPTAKNDTVDTDTPQTFTITFDPTKLIMIHAFKSNQTTKKAPKDKWGYNLLNDMYVKSGYGELSDNGNTVYYKYCKKYLVMRRVFNEIHRIISE